MITSLQRIKLNKHLPSRLASELGPNMGVRGLEVEHRGTSDSVPSRGTGLNLWENLVMYGKTLPCVVTVRVGKRSGQIRGSTEVRTEIVGYRVVSV